MENNNKDLQENHILSTDFATDCLFIVSLPEKYLSGALSWLIWTCVTNVVMVYIHSNILQLLINAVVHV
jgi:hypothetical protein